MDCFDEAPELAVVHHMLSIDWNGKTTVFRIEFGFDLKYQLIAAKCEKTNSHAIKTFPVQNYIVLAAQRRHPA